MNRPTFDRMGVVALIFPEGFTCVMIPFNHCSVMKAGIRHTNSESARPREKFNATHREIP